jgi:hypothetical protein
MSRHTNSGKFKTPQGEQHPHSREFARQVASLTDGDVRGMEAYRGEVDAALGRMFGPANRSVPHDVFHPNPAFTSGAAVVAEATANQPTYYSAQGVAHNNQGIRYEQQAEKVSGLNDGSAMPAVTEVMTNISSANIDQQMEASEPDELDWKMTQLAEAYEKLERARENA